MTAVGVGRHRLRVPPGVLSKMWHTSERYAEKAFVVVVVAICSVPTAFMVYVFVALSPWWGHIVPIGLAAAGLAVWRLWVANQKVQRILDEQSAAVDELVAVS